MALDCLSRPKLAHVWRQPPSEHSAEKYMHKGIGSAQGQMDRLGDPAVVAAELQKSRPGTEIHHPLESCSENDGFKRRFAVCFLSQQLQRCRGPLLTARCSYYGDRTMFSAISGNKLRRCQRSAQGRPRSRFTNDRAVPAA